ncbi:MAG: hypothetical protein QM756_11335 [Polyangiaceae bacterium]
MTLPSPAINAQGGGHGPPPGGFGAPPGGYGPAGGGYPPPFHAPPPGGYGPAPNYGMPTPPAPDPGPGAELKKQATNWLIVAAVTFLFAGGINCLGVIGAILCFLAMQAAEQGHLSDAESKLKWGKILIVTGTIISVVLWASALLYFVVAAAEGVVNS